MSALIDSLGAWGVPTVIVGILIALFLFMQVTGEIIEWCGKTAPAWLKVRKIFTAKRERIKRLEDTLTEATNVLAEINKHYNPDAIQRRNDWMTSVNNDLQWMHERADKYDQSIIDITSALNDASSQLQSNTLMTEDMYVEDTRDRIISFANMVADPKYVVSHEQFRRVFKIYDGYERFLEAKNRSNGEVTESMETIRKAYCYRQEHRSFAEDIGRYIK